MHVVDQSERFSAVDKPTHLPQAVESVRDAEIVDRGIRCADILADPRLQPDWRAPGIGVVSGGTDVHLLLVDLRDSELDGQQAEDRLHRVGITVNRNAAPFDPRPPMVSSGVRIGTSSPDRRRRSRRTPYPGRRPRGKLPALPRPRRSHAVTTQKRATRRTPPPTPQNIYGTTTHKSITMFLSIAELLGANPTPPTGRPKVATWSLIQACSRLASMTISQIAETRK